MRFSLVAAIANISLANKVKQKIVVLVFLEAKEGLFSAVLLCSSLHSVHQKELQVNLRTVYLFFGHQPAGLKNRCVFIGNVGTGMNGGGDIHFVIVFFGFGRPTYQTKLLIPPVHA